MLTIIPADSVQKDEIAIHVRLRDNYFYQATYEQMQIASAASGMTHVPFLEWFESLVHADATAAMNSPLHHAFFHCFPNKQITYNPKGPAMDKIRIVDRPISLERAKEIVQDLLDRVQGDWEKVRDVQAYLNILENVDADTYPHWIRLARIAAVSDPLDQFHANQ